MEPLALLLLILITLVVYFFPCIVAGARNHHNGAAILVTNIFLGWTFVGWVVCLVWAFTSKPEEKTIVQNETPKPKENSSVAEELEKLAKLKRTGVLTEEEFQAQKAKLLS